MPEDRKISEVIIDLETKVNRMVSLFQNLDNNVKLILNKLNSSQSLPPINQQPKIFSSPTEPIQQKPLLNQSVLVAEPYEESNLVDPMKGPEIEEEVVHKGKRRTRVPGDPDKSNKIAVSQQIVLPNGKNLFLASVEIFDANNKLIKQARTNTNGRWVCALEAGDYTIHVLKRQDDNNKLPVELRYKVTIPNSSSPMELPGPEFSGVYANQ